MAAKKKAAQKRPPRQVWLCVDETDSAYAFTTRKRAEGARCEDERVVGPYVLAERVRER